MKVQVKENGGSKIIIIPHVMVKYMGLKTNDWVDISDIVKVDKKENEKDI